MKKIIDKRWYRTDTFEVVDEFPSNYVFGISVGTIFNIKDIYHLRKQMKRLMICSILKQKR
jgi:hypothetical protein